MAAVRIINTKKMLLKIPDFCLHTDCAITVGYTTYIISGHLNIFSKFSIFKQRFLAIPVLTLQREVPYPLCTSYLITCN